MTEWNLTAEQIVEILAKNFAASLIISTLGWILYGVNICQFLHYVHVLAKRDHILTRVLVYIAMIFTSAAAFYQVYFDWSYSISLLITGPTSIPSLINGNIVVMYSAVVMLVQLFWLGCVHRLMPNNPRLSWSIVTPIGILSISAFLLAIAVGILSNTNPGEYGAWPTSTISILLRTLLSFDIAVDLSILIVIIRQLTVLRRSSVHLRKTISKLSYILCVVTLASTLIMITELIIDFPQLGKGGFINIGISFSPLFSPLYFFGMMAVLNERTRLWSDNRQRPSRGLDGKGLVPGMEFTVKPSSPPITSTRKLPPSNPNPATVPKKP